MWSLLAFSLLALLATGTCLECEVCNNIGNSCTGDRRICKAEEDVCVISVWDFSDLPLTFTAIRKDCGKSSTCKGSVAEINVGRGLHARGHRVCCTGSDCGEIADFDVPPPDTKPNGLQCPGCIGLFSPTCHGEPVPCVGTQNKCLDVSVNASGPARMEFSGKACVTELVCNLVQHGVSGFLGDEERVQAALSKADCIAATKPE
ncbi:phospholipase A2 inhibitor gamma subunit B-like [Elgaria multicarinata webbii]|uniref:phospholipase A2 inhibitor gamma subunit B-like n=1 Tax=Elgaria multicarinata webbii TaxID=159646 RepID=UPI002FCCBBE5